jgi:hypothetical protein
VSFAIRGTSLESCNCEPICPCRKIDGVPGGRSTSGECLGALSWRIASGHLDGLDLAGMAVVMAIRYHDDEPGSPWRWVLHLDERADEQQRAALEQIFTGRVGGTPREQFPWAFKPSELLEVVPSKIEIDHTPGRGWFRAGASVTVRIASVYETQSTVTCVIPGHHRPGREVVAERLTVRDQFFDFSFTGNCGFESTFEYTA